MLDPPGTSKDDLLKQIKYKIVFAYWLYSC